MSIALHTVFILNENIKWLEEFIMYYIHLGIEHFYLYDNEGSSGGDGTQSHNKYGFEASTTSSAENRNIFNNILLKYSKYITHIMWQPIDNNKIIYGQKESILECINKYGHLHEWMCFVDIDEFIFSEKDIKLGEYLNSLGKNVSCVKLIQKKFLDRFLTKEKYITQEYASINNFKIGTEWAPKNIIRCKDFIKLRDIHNIYTKNTTIVPHTDVLRFNHYNVNDKQIKWMVGFYKLRSPVTINGIDDGMKRYKFLFESP